MEATVLKSVLGIDAAWTATNPSGVALLVDNGTGWTLRSAASSYDEFSDPEWAESLPPRRPAGSVAEAAILLNTAVELAGAPVDIVTVDMPLSLEPITSRRVSDNKVSIAWGSRHCSTHTPSAERPGKISYVLREAFETLGYPLATTNVRSPGPYEVYPHPALVELTKAPKRLPYKASKTRTYWPGLSTLGSAQVTS